MIYKVLHASIRVACNYPMSMKEQCKSTTTLDLQLSNQIGQVTSDTYQLPRTHVLVIGSIPSYHLTSSRSARTHGLGFPIHVLS